MADSLEDFTQEQRDQMAATYKSLLDNPETREFALRATKKVNPNVVIPELDLKDAAWRDKQAITARQDKLEQEIRERDARDRINSERAALREQGFTADEVAAVEKIMVDEHIPSYATAARFYRNSQQVATPTPHNINAGARSYSLPETALDALKKGKNGLKEFGRNAASEALDDLRSGRIKLH